MSIKQKVLKILSGQCIPMSSLIGESQNQQKLSAIITMCQCKNVDDQQAKSNQDIERSIPSYVQFNS
jgi:hypothetical protein